MRLLALILLILALPAAAQEFPKLTGRVVDAANILPPETEAAIEARSAAIEQQTGAQLVVATVPSLQGYEIEDYGYRLGRAWGIGQKREAGGKGDNGVILLVAPNDRKVRIEVGYGLEPILTDALSAVIIQRAILPKFRSGDLPGGVADGFEEIAKQVALPPDQAVANVQAAAAAPAGDEEGIGLGAILFLLFLALWIWLAIRRSRGGRRSRAGGPIVIWGPGGGWGGGGGGWGGGGFGGGGFGGGGGGFGGGGASGGW
jgi:uncharacterized protein